MEKELTQDLESVFKSVFNADINVELTRPDEKFGDYATNLALQAAVQLGQNPRAIADQLVAAIKEQMGGKIADVTIAGPGFINLRLNDSTLAAAANIQPAKSLSGQKIVAEYSDPNPFKVLHAGHFYTSVVGDSVANLLEVAGAEVHRVNFGGDVGLHVGKAMWAILHELGGENPDRLSQIAEAERSEWMASAYVSGTQAYEDNEQAKAGITDLNKRIYGLHNDNDHDSPLAQIYWTCRQWSYDYFDQFYATIGSKFDKYYPESQTAPVGLQAVREHIGDVYEESQGAVIFDGEKYGLHNRVFINSEGLPTYETKDVGLIILKKQDYNFDRSVVITGNEQEQYMAVVLKSIEMFAPELAKNTVHLTHGLVKLQGGVKMSSRQGNFLRAVDVLDTARQASTELVGKAEEDSVLGAVKYAFLKNRTGGDIIYDPKESVSLEGNSGPYLQYAHARARSILSKTESQSNLGAEFQPAERSLLLKISEYPEVIDNAVAELMPHLLCTYLYELAQTFNRFYEHNRVVGDQRQDTRLALVELYADKLKTGLEILGIVAPDQM